MASEKREFRRRWDKRLWHFSPSCKYWPHVKEEYLRVASAKRWYEKYEIIRETLTAKQATEKIARLEMVICKCCRSISRQMSLIRKLEQKRKEGNRE